MRFTFRLLVLWLGAFTFAVCTPRLRAQINEPDDAELSSNRFLLVMDTAADMKRLQPDEIKIVAEIVRSAADGQLRRGDTLGVWTFAGDVYSDLPLQVWDAANAENIGKRISAYLRSRPFTGTSRFDTVLKVLLPLIQHSDVITIVIISDGKSRMKGTPFDNEINELYKQNLTDTKGHPEPIVTVLQGLGGKISQFSVNVAPWPVVIPAVPKTPSRPPKPRRAALPQPVVKPPPVATQTAPPTNVHAAIVDNPLPLPATIAPVKPVEQPAPAPREQSSAPPVPPQLPPSLTPPTTIPPPPPFAAPANPPPEVIHAQQSASPPLVVPPKVAPLHTPAMTPVVETPAPPATNASVAAPPKNPATEHPPVVAESEMPGRPKTLLIVGVALAVIGLILIVITVIRGRDTGPSLITRSMNDKRRG